MPPSRGREALGVSAAGFPPAAASRNRSISARKIFVSAATARGRSVRKTRHRFGTEGGRITVGATRHTMNVVGVDSRGCQCFRPRLPSANHAPWQFLRALAHEPAANRSAP